MKHKIEVVMLPNEIDIVTYSPIKTKSIFRFGETGISFKDPIGMKFQLYPLYITVSQDVEAIKVGDWVYSIRGFIGKFGEFENSYENECRKIIATTDPKCIIVKKYKSKLNPKGYKEQKETLPQLQQSFLKEFVANPDGEWEVEYGTEEDTWDRPCQIDCNGTQQANTPTCCRNKLILKLNQDNTVNITPVEDRTLPIHIHEGIYNTHVEIVDGIIHIKPNTNNSIKMYNKEDFIDSLQRYWDKMHGEGHQNTSMVSWIITDL